MAQAFGWRLAFVAVGLPGLVLALILFRTVPEPARTAAGEDDSTPPFRAVLRRLGKSPAFLNLTCGSGLVGLVGRSEEHTSELQSLMRISYAVFCLTKQTLYYNLLSRIVLYKYF